MRPTIQTAIWKQWQNHAATPGQARSSPKLAVGGLAHIVHQMDPGMRSTKQGGNSTYGCVRSPCNGPIREWPLDAIWQLSRCKIHMVKHIWLATAVSSPKRATILATNRLRTTSKFNQILKGAGKINSYIDRYVGSHYGCM